MPPARRSSPTGPAGPTWRDVPLAPIVLVRGTEGVLVDRAVARLAGLVRQHDPEAEVTQIEAAAYDRGQLDTLTSPSLFGEHRHLVISGAETASEAFIEDALTYLAAAGPTVTDVTMVIRHEKGTRGKKLLDAIAKAGYPVVTCEAIKRDSDKLEFAAAEFSDAGRRATRQAVQALVEALGSDLRELTAGCSQLISDTTGTITPDVVERYYGGRVEATGFRVADAAVAGERTQAVTLLRHALETGVDPVPLVAVLAMKLRTLAKVAAARGSGSAADLGMAPWQVDRARRDLRGWSPEGLAAAIVAVADADAQVKGEGRDARFAVERAVLRVVAARQSRA
ncbi:DNA polymerase III subunit delta [Ruania halotolerans]|uniref:DNA polymerase III subunit delta n=1 Tax=Ruania halotolerans TaxID=2897773 RepID=UPI001E324C50|nr:DNA polymerase III subunit delta [Ruania halotolerans]UFU04950.1 DNA polymerase III subunit delta [Ruania halotolerans]